MNYHATGSQTPKDFEAMRKVANSPKPCIGPSATCCHFDLLPCCNCNSHAAYHVYNSQNPSCCHSRSLSCSCSCSCSHTCIKMTVVCYSCLVHATTATLLVTLAFHPMQIICLMILQDMSCISIIVVYP